MQNPRRPTSDSRSISNTTETIITLPQPITNTPAFTHLSYIRIPANNQLRKFKININRAFLAGYGRELMLFIQIDVVLVGDWICGGAKWSAGRWGVAGVYFCRKEIQWLGNKSGNQSQLFNQINSLMENKIPPEFFFRHVEKVREIWTSVFFRRFQRGNYDMDSLVLVNGKGNTGNEKTIAIVSWFFAGYNLADTIVALSQKAIAIYASDRKITFLNNLRDDPAAKRYNLALYPKNDDSNATFQKIWSDLHGANPAPKVGMILGDSKTGQIAEEFTKFQEAQGHSKVEALNFFNQCFMVKDAEEIENLRKSSRVTGYFFAKLVKEVEVVIDSGKTTKHSELAKKVLDFMENDSELKKCAIKLSSQKVVKDYIDIGAPCSIQSGGNYSTKLFTESNEKDLKSDCILLGLGTMYRSYNTFIGRTLLIDPNEEQKSIYKKVETLVKVITQNLRPGVKICDVYKKARQFMQDTLPALEVPKVFGYGMGIFLHENNLAINETNERVIQPGFSFLISCNFPEIKYESKKHGPKKFAIQLSDNAIVIEKGQEILTGEIAKALTEISYSLEDEDEERKPSKPKETASSNVVEGRRRKVQEATNEKLKNQKERNEHQMVLKKKKLEELQERSNENFSGDFKKQKTIECNKIECYKNREELPRDLKKNLIYIDNKTNSILLPISGQHVPFHIVILKSVVKNDEGKHASLRFNFHLPNSIPTLNFPKYTEPVVFVKEIVFRSQNVARITELEKQVKALQKKVRLELSEKNAKEDIVEQEKININKGKRPILRQLYARPGIGQKKTKGTLECHLNGFRYSTIKNETIDVPFSNIKFAFFQPCEKEIIAAIHFRLNEPILVGKKKTEDIQFYSEGGVVAEDVVGRGREDSDDEERQKDVKRRIDRDFLAWCKACEEFTAKRFEFEVPNRNLGFYGTTFRSNVLLQPTKTCLINITEPHFFVFCIDDIEVVWFERMTGNVRYFDLTVVHKDYERYVRINSISIKDVEKVKDWLDSNSIIFYDNKISVNWNKFLQGVRVDFKKFVEDGAWTAWDEADEEGEGDISDEDSEFSAESDEFEEESDDSEESESDYENEDDSDDSDASEELSEEGLDWDEMEEKAEREDREKLRREMEKEKEREKVKVKKR